MTFLKRDNPIFSAAYRLAGSFNMRGRLRQLFYVLNDDSIGSGPRPEPNSLQDPVAVQPQAELVEQAVQQIQQDHVYTAQNRTTPTSSQRASNQQTPGSKRKSEAEAKASQTKRR